MDRRDFLLFKTRGPLRVADLSCERLYMHSVDAGLAGEEAGQDFRPEEGGEPPTAIERLTSHRLFESLERDLVDVDVVRVADREWLGSLPSEWRKGLDALLASVRARGGQVELVPSRRTASATGSGVA